MSKGFQDFVNLDLPKGVAGDFASMDPVASVIAGVGQFVAGAIGLVVGQFGWFDPATGLADSFYKPNSFLGFVHRESQAMLTTFLQYAGMVVPVGYPVTGMSQGAFWGLFIGGATVGQKVYANPLTGALSSAATGGTISGLNTAGATIASNVLTTTDADQTGSALAVGQLVTGGTMPPGTYIQSAVGAGAGLHTWNLANINGTAIPDNAVAFTLTNLGIQETKFNVDSAAVAPVTSTACSIAANTGVLTTGGAASGGSIVVGDYITGTGVPPGLRVTAQLTGAAGTGGGSTYQTNTEVAVGAATFTFSQGQVAKISSWQ